MNKITKYGGLFLAFLFLILTPLSARHQWVDISKQPPSEDSAIAAYLSFAKACSERNIEHMRLYAGRGYTFRLKDNDPKIVSGFVETFGMIDYEKPISYTEIRKSDEHVVLGIKYTTRGTGEPRKRRQDMRHDGKSWKVGN